MYWNPLFHGWSLRFVDNLFTICSFLPCFCSQLVLIILFGRIIVKFLRRKCKKQRKFTAFWWFNCSFYTLYLYILWRNSVKYEKKKLWYTQINRKNTQEEILVWLKSSALCCYFKKMIWYVCEHKVALNDHKPLFLDHKRTLFYRHTRKGFIL